MRVASRIARWNVSPKGDDSVTLAIDGIEYVMSIAESFALVESLDDVSAFQNRNMKGLDNG